MKAPGRASAATRVTHAAAELPRNSEPWICRKCTGIYGAHFLTCPVLRLPQPAGQTEANR